MTYCGDERAVGGRVVAERVLLLHPGQELHPGLVVALVAGVGLGLRAPRSRSAITSRASPTIGTSACRFLPISAGSMSAWMTLACGANESRLPVTRSSKRAPRLMIRSLRWSAGDRRHGAVHAGHAEVLRVAVGERAAGHQRGDDRHPGHLGEHPQLLGGAGADHAAADVQHRAPRLEDQPGGLADLLGVRAGHRAVAGQHQLGRPAERGLRLHRVLGHVDQHRAGTAGRGDVERLGDGPRDVGGVGDQEVVLGDRHRDAADVGLLEGVGADRGAGDLAGDRDHRHRVHVGVGDRGDQVGRARPAGRHADADLAGGAGVALGRVAGALLVPDQDVPDLDRVVERVVRREDRAARDAEDVLGARALQGLDQALCPGDRGPRRPARS